MKDIQERFAAMVVATEDGCWLWTGYLNRSGYGTFSAGGKTFLAHRFSWLQFIGPIPQGMPLDHVRAYGCYHRHCVNPAHLEAVTTRENVHRGEPYNRTHCRYGHEFTPGNTYVQVSKQGWTNRQCRECRRIRNLAYYHAKKHINQK